MGTPCSTIQVLDGNGDEITVYEVWDRPRFFGFITDRRFMLCDGEEVAPLDRHTFVVAATGETLKRIEKPS